MKGFAQILFPNDQKEDVVVKLGLSVEPYCGRDDTQIPTRRLFQRRRLKCGSQESQGGVGAGHTLTVKKRVYCGQIPEQRVGPGVGIIPMMSFLPRALVCPGRKTIFCVVCKASD